MTFASRAIPRLIGLCLLLALFARPQLFEPVFRPLANTGAPAIYVQAELWSLALSMWCWRWAQHFWPCSWR